MEQNPSYISTVIPTLAFTVSWFVIGLTVFGPLHWMFEARRAVQRSQLNLHLRSSLTPARAAA
jgi:hypothetical protein